MPLALESLPNYGHGRFIQMLDGSLIWSNPKSSFIIPCGNRLTEIAIAGEVFSFKMSKDFTLDKIIVTLEGQASASGTFEVDVKAGGTTVFATPPTLDAGEDSSATAAVQPILSTLTIDEGTEVGIFVTNIGDGHAAGLVVEFVGHFRYPVGADITPPSTPTLTATTLNFESIQIDRSNATDNIGVTSYEIRVNGGSLVNQIYSIGLTDPYTLTGLDPDTDYTIEVRAKDAAGNVSPWSASDTAHTDIAPLPLDAITVSVWGAYGTKKLKNSYSGFCLRVKDNLGVEEDIGFDVNGDIDVSALSGDAPYYVKTLYDQSGGGHNLSEIAAGHGAKLDVANKNLRFEYTGGSHFLGYAVGNLSAFTAGEMFVKRKIDDDPSTGGAGGDGQGWKFGTDANPSYIPATNGLIYEDFGSTARKDAIPHTDDLEAFHVYSAYSVSGDHGVYLNGTLLNQTGTNTVGFNTACAFGRQGSAGMVGNVQTLIICNAKANTTDRNYLHANL